MKHLFFIALIMSSFIVYGQNSDLIVTVAGDSLNCKITELRAETIYFRYDASGNVVSLPMSQVASYTYDFYSGRRGTPAVAVSMRGRSELSFYLGGGLSDLTFKPAVGSRSSGIGGLCGIGFTWFVSGRWGVVTGIEAALYQSEYVAGTTYTGKDYAMSGTLGSVGNDFEFAYAYQNYSEKQSALFLQIPVMAQFQTGRFFASAGIKIGIPASGKFDVAAAELTTSGYFPNHENQTYENVPHGFGDYSAVSYSGNLDMNICYSAALEAGGQWFLGKRTNLYVGAWLDYGLSNLSKTGVIGIKKPVVEYDHNASGYLRYNSIVDTTDKLNVMSVGLKVKLTYSL